MIKEFKSKADRKMEEIEKEHDAESEVYQAELARLEMKVNNGATLTEEDAAALLTSMGKMARLTREHTEAVDELLGREPSKDAFQEARENMKNEKVLHLFD